MAALSKPLPREDLIPGDHIYSWRGRRPLRLYAHHGIYVDKKKELVIHVLAKPVSAGSTSISIGSVSTTNSLTSGSVSTSSSRVSPNWPCPKCGYDGSSGVVVTCLDCFLKGGNIYRYEYGVSKELFKCNYGGTCHTIEPDPSTIAIINRAWDSIAQGFGNYSLTDNNCENFALYCKIGRRGVQSEQVARKCILTQLLLLCSERLSS